MVAIKRTVTARIRGAVFIGNISPRFVQLAEEHRIVLFGGASKLFCECQPKPVFDPSLERGPPVLRGGQRAGRPRH